MGRLTFQPGDVEISAIDLIDIDGKKNPISIKNLIENDRSIIHTSSAVWKPQRTNSL
jgi:hypothetical protein